MHRVLIPTKLNSVAKDILEEHGFDVVQDADTDFTELIKANADVHALIVRSEKVTAEVIDALPNLRVIARAGAGYDNIDIKHARRQSIDVMNTPGANSNAVAEEVIAMVLAGYRNVVRADVTTRAGEWEKKKLMGRELTGKVVGVVGMGNIGQHLVRRLAGFDCKILTFDPVLSGSKAKELGVTLSSLEDIFSQCDIISLHVPETDATRGMVNQSLLSLAKDGLLIVNCARAGVVDEDALRQAKAEKGLIYCNDVYPKDAPGEKTIADVADLMLPHLGASTQEANYNAAKRAADQIVAYVKHGVNTYVVNKALPAGLDAEYQSLAYYLTKVVHGFLGQDVPSRIEVSFYGDLSEYSNWLVAPIVLGLSADFDPLFDYNQAEDVLREKGITLAQRKADESKGYGNSMTIDLIEGAGQSLRRASIRGTITEGNAMVSRINDFDKLYFDPCGESMLIVYQDKPGMLAKITGVMARHGINIDDIRAPHDPKTGDSMAVLHLNQPASKEIAAEIVNESGAKMAVPLSVS